MANTAKLQEHDDLEFALLGLESAKDLQTIKTWIELIAAVPSEDAARVLLKTYRNTHWRDTKKLLLQAMGHTSSARALRHLIQVASDSSDLPLAEVAIQALAQNPSPLGQQFLMNLLGSQHSPLTTAILNGLARKPWMINAQKIAQMTRDLPPSERSLEQFIVALGRLGRASHAETIEEFLNFSTYESHRNLFVAALISAAKIGGKRSLEKIMVLPLDHDISISELRMMTREAIQKRLALGPKDLILLLNDAEQVSAALELLKEIPAAKIWAEVKASPQSLNPQGELWLRAMTLDTKRLDEDLNFIKKHAHEFSEESLEIMCIKISELLASGQAKMIQTFLACFSELRFSKFFALCPVPFMTKYLLESLKTNSASEKLQAINLLSQHALIFPFASPSHESICQALVKTLNDKEQEVRERCLRALGELHYQGKEFLEKIKGLYSNSQISLSTLIYYFDLMPAKDNNAFLLKILKQELGKKPLNQDLVCSLLSPLRQSLQSDTLQEQDSALLQKTIVSLDNELHLDRALSFLAQQQIPGCEPLISKGLHHTSFLVLLSAVAASRLNQNDEIRDRLLDLVQHPEPVIRIRSIDSLSRNTNYKSHKVLIQYFEQNPNREPTLMLQAFSCMVPASDSDYRPLQAALKRLQKHCRDIPVKLHESLIGLIESMDHQILMRDIVAVPAQDMHHDLDDELDRDLPGYSAYTVTMKSVLRNAELTLKRKDVFDHRIDQSTAIVQYVKTIDLLLHEKLGAKLFQGRDENMLSKMQSTLYLLTLDQQQSQGQNYLDILQIQNVFKEQNFPGNKLRALCNEIMSGRILNQYNRVVDGLRAWALILLLFGRNFSTADGVRVTACLPLKQTSANTINQISKALHDLQEIRNEAAHRGTTLDDRILLVCRQQSLKILGELIHIL